ncbi:hypothetical protein [Pseudolabrys sp. FHR47]|uniref:hypothetical protein n=1 Tax=Pseudolabrys sp. FHR47 TaxID=2562284 RepID=UPI0010BEA90C|nr:hypothetical protein [Pseudolabrys sp. FHR47]
MSEQINMTHDQLAELIAKDVRRRAHCEGFSSIALYQLKDGQIPGINWSEGPINFGTADEDECVRALREIIPRMQKQYRLVAR